MELLEARGRLVRQYRANRGPWPQGIGAWYRAEDWSDSGELLADGEARVRALDAWANVRAWGEDCPPLPVTGVDAASTVSVVDGGPVDASAKRKKSERQARWRVESVCGRAPGRLLKCERLMPIVTA